MKQLYETKASNAKWIACDLPANIGWISYLVCLILAFVKTEHTVLNAVALIPAALMLCGLAELISERIAGLDRILPKARLLRGFGAFWLGGVLAVPVTLVAVIAFYHAVYVVALVGALLCALFGGLLLFGYKKQEQKNG